MEKFDPFSPNESNQLAANEIKVGNEGNGVNPASRFFFYYEEWKRSNNGRFVSFVDDAIDGAQIKRSWGKSGVLFAYAPRCFMIIYGPDGYAPSGKLNNREEVF